MEDFNNIEFDPIPEGLEFNESYMQDAFALYDAEKQKRKRRLLIWWFTSALGFSCILLAGVYFFTREAAGSVNLETPQEKHSSAQKISAKNNDPDVVQQNQAGKSRLTVYNTLHSSAKSNSIRSDKRIITKSTVVDLQTNSAQNRNRAAFKQATGSHQNKRIRKRTASGIATGTTTNKDNPAINNHSGDFSSTVAISGDSKEIVQTDSRNLYPNPGALPLKPALLACNNDSVSKPVIDSLKDVFLPEVPVRKHQLFMNLGVNTLFGMKELQHRVIFKESIGLSYSYQLSQKIGIGIGLEYHSLPRVSYRRIVSDTTNSDKTTTILNKTTLNYISLYPQMSYRLGDKQQITAGFGIEYLLTDPGERYEIKTYTDETPKRVNSKLYYSTFNRFNFSVSIGYVYQFSRFMSVQAQYHYGFTDITKNNSFNQTFDRNSRLQLGLRIRLL